MEGTYTKIGGVCAIIAVLVAIYELWPTTTPSLAGEWDMTTKVYSAQRESYEGLEIFWSLHLSQNGLEVSGTAEKNHVNAQALLYSQRTSMDIHGAINSDSLFLRFTEHGKLRTTQGTMRLAILRGKTLKGTFSQTASDSEGSVHAIKVH